VVTRVGARRAANVESAPTAAIASHSGHWRGGGAAITTGAGGGGTRACSSSTAWRARGDDTTRVLLAWAIPFWLVLELVPTKLPNYILPVYPALAMMAAAFIAKACSRLVCPTPLFHTLAQNYIGTQSPHSSKLASRSET